MLLAKLYAMPLLKSGLALVTGNGMGSPGLTRAASRDLHVVCTYEISAGGVAASSGKGEEGQQGVVPVVLV